MDVATDIANGSSNDRNSNGVPDSCDVNVGEGYPFVDFSGSDTPFNSFRDITSGDVDADGDIDLVVTRTSDGIRVFSNLGDGSYAESPVVETGEDPIDHVMLDLDDDGALDLAAVNRSSHNVSILFNDGAGKTRQRHALFHELLAKHRHASCRRTLVRFHVIFAVVGDGKVLRKSKRLKGKGTHECCEVRVNGVDELELRTDCPGAYNWLHGVWLEPVVAK